ncbi:unnamed protein product [Rotaria magnacalcarata]|uniref:Uncharacterized protein n=1 Tax=Rotaria magnacalcarata TaxID=392030 RepID=A0A819G9Q1_9BILA|nr:unnamed protein product [Rotaria magnacalcarata]
MRLDPAIGLFVRGKQFQSVKIELWEQCDGKGLTLRRVCGNSAHCYARDISYWQCRPNGNCPAEESRDDVTVPLSPSVDISYERLLAYSSDYDNLGEHTATEQQTTCTDGD